MRGEMVTYSLPRWRVTQWLADPGPGVSDEVRIALIGELFGSLPVFAAGVINTVAVAGADTLPAGNRIRPGPARSIATFRRSGQSAP